jgi:UDP-glucose 4-epimerase
MDLVGAHILGLDWLRSGKGNRVFNLGTGTGFSVREVVEACAAVTGLAVPVVEGPPRPGDCVRLVSGSSRAQQELGWRHDRSTLSQMIADAWRWSQGPGFSA